MEKWSEVGIRQKLLYMAATASFVLGWAITFMGFYAPPKGEIDNTVIVVFGQAMTFAGYGYGLKEFIDWRIGKKENS